MRSQMGIAALALFVSTPALAQVTYQSGSFTPTSPTSVDASFDQLVHSFSMNALDPTYWTSDVQVTVEWQKTDGSCIVPASGTPYHNETGMALIDPHGRRVELLSTGRWISSGSNPLVSTAFRDSFIGTMPATDPISGDFQPDEPLSVLYDNTANGTWQFVATDTVAIDPLCIHSVELEVWVEPAIVVNANGPYEVPEGTAPTLAATGSDPGIYDWDCTDDGIYDTFGAITSDCVYDDDGVYNARLRVTVAPDQRSTIAQVVVTNVAPTMTSVSADSTAFEGIQVTLTATATDPGADTLTYTWDFGSGEPLVGDSVQYTFPQNGSYDITVTVDDGDGGSDSWVETIVVENVAPTIISMEGPNEAYEGVAYGLLSMASDLGGDPISFDWDFGDGTTSTEQSPVHAWPDNGSYTVTLTVTDDLGASTSQSIVIDVLNADPVVAALGTLTIEEASEWAPNPIVADVLADTLAFQWDFGDGTTSTDPLPTHTWNDNGDFVVTLTVSDEDGGLTQVQGNVVVTNVAPTISSVSLPEMADEGSEVAFEVVGADVSPVDTLSALWDFADTNTSTQFAGVHSWADDGSFEVVVTVTDDDGDGVSEVYTIDIMNVPPQFVNAADETALEGDPYSFEPVVDDPGDDVMSFELDPPVDGASVDPATGELSWTPSYAQASAGTVSFALRVSDDDGGEDWLEWDVAVDYLDVDEDGLADTWETENGFDPTNPNDNADDPDGDGRDNGWEFAEGSDPNTYEGPEAPVLVTPMGGEEVNDLEPTLVWSNAARVFDDPLTYDVEVYEDNTMATLITSYAMIAETELETMQLLQATLTENSDPFWRVRAVDPYVAGPWSIDGDFFFNGVEEAPPVPDTLFPVDAMFDDLLGALQASTVEDPDRDGVAYAFEVMADGGVDVLSAGADVHAEDMAVDVWWESNVPFEENGAYLWRVMAIDEHGDASEWSDWAWFVFSAEAEAPTETAWIAPNIEDRVESLQPDIVLAGVEDPEGLDLSWTVELSTDQGFGSVEHTITGESMSSLDDVVLVPGVELEEHRTWYARAEAMDADGFTTPVVQGTFFTHGPNDAPSTPEIAALEPDAEDKDKMPSIIFNGSEDPEDDGLNYEIELLDDMGELISAEEIDHNGAVEHVFVPDYRNGGNAFTVRLRAIDEFGAASDWTEALSSEIEGGDGGGGCGCASGGSSVAWFGLLPLLLVRRRR